ncbi:hypothetical protein ACFPRA_19485 [Sporosarcina soli]|uniref:Uncharacterized protein n=1 Tax=Sporosarcina soli TaxID=334736 RepID=A0ABW0TQH9_9BACL
MDGETYIQERNELPRREKLDVLLITVIFALIEILKYLKLPHKLLPIPSLIFGVVGGVCYIFPHDLKFTPIFESIHQTRAASST